jgi:hypothetical protein
MGGLTAFDRILDSKGGEDQAADRGPAEPED